MPASTGFRFWSSYWEHLGSMLLVLPEGHDLPSVERSIDEGMVRAWRAQLENKPVHVFLPEFEASVTSQVGSWLMELGARTMFEGSADLSGIASAPLRVSAVRHTANIRTDRIGTRLADASDIPITTGRVGTSETSPTFRADRSST